MEHFPPSPVCTLCPHFPPFQLNPWSVVIPTPLLVYLAPFSLCGGARLTSAQPWKSQLFSCSDTTTNMSTSLIEVYDCCDTSPHWTGMLLGNDISLVHSLARSQERIPGLLLCPQKATSPPPPLLLNVIQAIPLRVNHALSSMTPFRNEQTIETRLLIAVQVAFLPDLWRKVISVRWGY